MLTYSTIKDSLLDISKSCRTLWEENKDLQGRFVNDLGELERMQSAINRPELDRNNVILLKVRSSMTELQKNASQLYENLMERRCCLTQKLNDGVHNIALFQNQLITERLCSWKSRQKLAQVGIPFDEHGQLLNEIQSDFEYLAEQIWLLRTLAYWQLDLLRRGPQLNDNTLQSNINNLSTISDSLTKLLCMLISQSFVVSIQPEPVLKTQHKFFCAARILLVDKLGIRQLIANTNVTVMIISEDDAYSLSTARIAQKDVKSIGTISNDFERLVTDEDGHTSATFNNSKLIRIAHRKAPSKATECKTVSGIQAAADQKYALLFHISAFQVGSLGRFDLWTLSLPVMVTVHGSQDCDAKGSILWQRAFANVNRHTMNDDVSAVSWLDLQNFLKHIFTHFTSARRSISQSDFAYMADKLGIGSNNDRKLITYHQFARQNLREDVNFSFWEWFFGIMQLIKHKLLQFWDDEWLTGFIDKESAANQMVSAEHLSFLLRFSDTQTGAVSISFVCEDGDKKIPFHLSPFSIRDLEQFSLAQRIASCPQLKDTKFLYPDIVKDEMLRFFECEESQKLTSPTGYIQSEIVMLAKTGEISNLSASSPSSDSPMSIYQSKFDWSPCEINHRAQVMVVNDEKNTDNSVETLLGPDFRPQIFTSPFEPVDLSFIDASLNLADCRMID